MSRTEAVSVRADPEAPRSKPRKNSGAAGGVQGKVVRALERSSASLLATGALAGVVLSLAWREGGFFPPAFLDAGGVVFSALALLLAVSRPSFSLAREAIVAGGALLALAGWLLLSSTWSPSPPSGLEAAQRAFVYVGVFGVAVTAAGSGRATPVVLWATIGVMATVVLAGLVSRFFPSGALLPRSADPSQYRLNYPLGYWNAFGAMAAMLAVLTAGVAGDRRAPVAFRAASSAISVLAIVAMYLSLSRGAWLALAFAIVVLVASAPSRGSICASVLVIAAAAGASILLLRSYPALVDDPLAGAGARSAGRQYAPILIAVIVLAAVGQVAIAAAGRRLGRSVVVLRWARLGAFACGAILLIGGIVGYASKSARVNRFVSRQWSEFVHPAGAPSGSGSARLTNANTTRGDVYRVALDEFADAPLFGVGAGGFTAGWYRDRSYAEDLRNAHSLYLETLAETGIVGLLLLLTFLGGCLAAGVRTRLRPTGLRRSQTSAVLAATTVWIVHAGVDWDWQVSALSVVAIILLGTLFPMGRRTRVRSHPRQLLIRAAAVGCVLAAAYLWISAVQARRLVNANRLGRGGHYLAALREARDVSVTPYSDEAALTEARALQDLGRVNAAIAEYRRAADADPSNWTIRLEWAVALLQGGQMRSAQTQLGRALRLNPDLTLPPQLIALPPR